MHNNRVTRLFYIIFVFDVVLNLIPTWNSSFVTRFMPIETYKNFVISLSKAVNTVFFLLIFVLSKKRDNNNLLLIILMMSVWAFLSIIVNLNLEYFVTFVGLVVSYLGLFCVKDYKFAPKLVRIASFLIVLWSISSVCYLPFASGEHYLSLFNAEFEQTAVSFCGWGTHRNHYGFYAGLSLLLLYINKNNIFVRIICTAILLIGIFLSGCRTVLLASFVVLFYLAWKNTTWKQRLLFFIVAASAVFALFYFGNELESRIISSENDDRNELVNLFIAIILANPVFGTGSATMAFSGNYSEGSPCHNFLLQTSADFGIPVMFMFLYFLFLIFKSSTREGRAVLIYLVLFGLTQPYFTFNCPIQFTLIAYLFIVYYNHICYANPEELHLHRSKIVHKYA